MPRVSVIMPCFNDGKYIEESIQSVKNQTYKDWELIIVDDGSNDVKTLEILKTINNSKIKVIYSINEGPSAARNKGIEMSKGVYILPLDADDLIEPTYIEKALGIIEADSNVGIVYCEGELFGKQSGKWNLPEYNIGRMLHNNVIFISALFRKKDWTLVRGFNENLKQGIEDYDFWLSIIELNRSVYRIPEILFKYRIKDNSRNAMFFKNQNSYLETHDAILRNHRKLYIENLRDVMNEFRKSEYEYNKKLDKLKKLIPGYIFVDKFNWVKSIAKKILSLQ